MGGAAAIRGGSGGVSRGGVPSLPRRSGGGGGGRRENEMSGSGATGSISGGAGSIYGGSPIEARGAPDGWGSRARTPAPTRPPRAGSRSSCPRRRSPRRSRRRPGARPPPAPPRSSRRLSRSGGAGSARTSSSRPGIPRGTWSLPPPSTSWAPSPVRRRARAQARPCACAWSSRPRRRRPPGRRRRGRPPRAAPSPPAAAASSSTLPRRPVRLSVPLRQSLSGLRVQTCASARAHAFQCVQKRSSDTLLLSLILLVLLRTGGWIRGRAN